MSAVTMHIGSRPQHLRPYFLEAYPSAEARKRTGTEGKNL